MNEPTEKRWFFLLILLVTSCFALAQSNKNYLNGTALLKSLFDDNYDNQVRPFYKERKVNVTADIYIVAFSSIKEVDMEYSMDIYFGQTWTDPRLIHSDDEDVIVKEDNIYKAWIPDTYFLNMKKATELTLPSKSKKLIINSKGKVIFSMRLGVTASCDMNFERYPMDSQYCKLILLSYSHDLTKLDYNWDTNLPVQIQDPSLSEYEITEYTTTRSEVKYNTGIYTHLEVRFVFKRRIEYSMLHIFAPTFFIVCISWMSFWISKESAPARVGLGVTTILTIVTLIGSVRSYVPRVSYIKAVDYYLIVSFCFVFGSMMEYVLVIMHAASVNRLSVQLRAEVPVQPTSPVEMELQELNGCDSDQPQQKQGRGKRTNRAKSMRGSAKKLYKYVYFSKNTDKVDKIARIAVPLTYVLFNIVYMIAYGATGRTHI